MNKIITGDTVIFTFSVLYEGAVASKEAPDLSESDVVFAIKRRKTDPDSKVFVKKTIENPDTNILNFELTAQETSRMVEGTYSACCKIYFDSGEEKTVWMDDLVVIKGVLGAKD